MNNSVGRQNEEGITDWAVDTFVVGRDGSDVTEAGFSESVAVAITGLQSRFPVANTVSPQ